MKTEIVLKNLQKKVPIQPRSIEKIAKAVLHLERVQKFTLSVVFVTDRKIKALNKKYLHRDQATDVLAFDLTDEEFGPGPMGEIVISADTAVRNAKLYKTRVEEEIHLYVIHGLLHLLGYDDHEEKNIRRMRRKETIYLQYLRK